ncbi:MAG TPA: alpha/beta hydrolase family protein, partial [Bryobacteraceae bacterium]|nr:alpha/beta hydrolase family protein [Bryobacteraceae bacterium]
VPALFAAALDKNITELYLAGGLVSFRNIVDTENYDHSFANFVPGLLRHTDLPDVAAALAPRPVTLAGTVDAEGRAMESAAVHGIYSGSHVKIRDKADWDIGALSGWNA